MFIRLSGFTSLSAGAGARNPRGAEERLILIVSTGSRASRGDLIDNGFDSSQIDRFVELELMRKAKLSQAEEFNRQANATSARIGAVSNQDRSRP